MCVMVVPGSSEGKQSREDVLLYSPLPSEQVPHLVADKPSLQGYQVPDSFCEAVAVDLKGHRVGRMMRSWSGETQVLQRRILARVREGRGQGRLGIYRRLCETRAMWGRGRAGEISEGGSGDLDWAGRKPWLMVAGL